MATRATRQTTTRRRKNPADLTGRNLHALHHELVHLGARMRLLELVVDGILSVQVRPRRRPTRAKKAR